MTYDPEVDRYIEGVTDSLKPMVLHLRAAFHVACPGVRESIKWSAPHFEYKGLDVPDWFRERIERDPNALATWNRFSRSHRNEYVEWVTGAKQEATRERRLQQALEWMAEGKPKEWKYMKEWRE